MTVTLSLRIDELMRLTVSGCDLLPLDLVRDIAPWELDAEQKTRFLPQRPHTYRKRLPRSGTAFSCLLCI